MKKFTWLVLLIVACIVSHAQVKKTLFVIVDGIPADVIEKLNTPFIDSIAAHGGFKKAYVGGEKNGYSQTPTISAVGYNTVLTGTWVNKHNVWDNDIAAPNYNYKTVFHYLKNTSPQKKIGIFSSWQDNRTKLVNLPFDYQFDGLELDTIQYPQNEDRAFMHRIDEAVTNSAASCIKLNAPDLSWVYLEYTDDMGHMFGDSPKFYTAVEIMDKQMGRLWESIQYRQQKFNEQWLMIITTDHGRDSATGKHHGGQSDRERAGWIATNAKDLNEHFKEGSLSIADIMPTVARFMNIKIPKDDAMEIDGVPFIGSVHATEAKATINNNLLKVEWKKIGSPAPMKVWLSTTNQYKTGGRDKYKLVKKVSSANGQVEIDVTKYPSDFYKVVLEEGGYYLNRWILKQQ